MDSMIQLTGAVSKRSIGSTGMMALLLAANLAQGRAAELPPTTSPIRVTLPPLVAGPVPAMSRPVRLSEPTPRVWLPLVGESRVHQLPPRTTPAVRPQPEPLLFTWMPPEPMPARDALAVGPKVRASVVNINAAPVPPLLTVGAVPAPSPSVADSLLADYLGRTIVYWREQAVAHEWPVIPDAQSEVRSVRLRDPLPEVPWLPPGLVQPPRPPLPTSQRQ